MKLNKEDSMYLDETVPVPRVEGKITIKKVRETEYVYFETERVYDSR